MLERASSRSVIKPVILRVFTRVFRVFRAHWLTDGWKATAGATRRDWTRVEEERRDELLRNFGDFRLLLVDDSAWSRVSMSGCIHECPAEELRSNCTLFVASKRKEKKSSIQDSRSIMRYTIIRLYLQFYRHMPFQVIDYLRKMERKYPNLIELETLGYTVENREILLAKVSWFLWLTCVFKS